MTVRGAVCHKVHREKQLYISYSFMSFVLIALVLLLTGCGGNKREAEKKEAVPVTVVKGVELEVVRSTAMQETLEVVGTVRARSRAVVSARIPGTVSVLRVREGDRVKKGQILAQLDAQENQAAAVVANAGIDEARQGLNEALSRKKLTDTTFERYQKLFDEQAVTHQEFDSRQTEKILAAQGVERSEARLKQAQAGSRAASTMAGYTRIVAPISGVITSKQADLGVTVLPAQPLMTIEDEGSYQLELSVPESLGTRIIAGTPVQVTLDALASSFATKITEIVPATDPASRTFIVKIVLNQKGLKSGMFGRGAINLGTTVNGITLPKNAVVERGALTSIWVVDKDNSARMRIVKIGRILNDRVEILSGMSAGERVVVDGVEKVIEGSKVE